MKETKEEFIKNWYSWLKARMPDIYMMWTIQALTENYNRGYLDGKESSENRVVELESEMVDIKKERSSLLFNQLLDKGKIQEMEEENNLLKRKLKETEVLFSNQVKTNSELFQENKELKEEVKRLKGLFEDCWYNGSKDQISTCMRNEGVCYCNNGETEEYHYEEWAKENNIE